MREWHSQNQSIHRIRRGERTQYFIPFFAVVDNRSLEKKAEDLRKVFGAQIKEAREALCYTQAQLARMSGMTKNYLSALERGKAVARHDKLLELSEILGIDFIISARVPAAKALPSAEPAPAWRPPQQPALIAAEGHAPLPHGPVPPQARVPTRPRSRSP